MSKAHSAEACPRTLATTPLSASPFPSSDAWYGSEKLAVVLPKDGLWRGMGPEKNYRDKLFWWSRGFKPGSESELTVSARRLDADSSPATISKPSNASSKSLGGWTMLVMVEFPSAGCWEITGKYLGHELTAVVEVGGQPDDR